jgi:hypothetical protein
MHMHIGDNTIAARAANLPEARQGGLANGDDAGRQRLRVDIVVKDELEDFMRAVVARPSEEIGAALPRFA